MIRISEANRTDAVERQVPEDRPIDTVHSPTPVLPDPEQALICGNDIGAAVAAMVMLSAKEQRKTARTSRDAAYEAMESAQRDVIKNMRSAANARFAGGLTSGGLTIASGGTSIAGGTIGAQALGPQHRADAAAHAGRESPEIATASRLTNESKGWEGTGTILKGGAQVSEAVGEFIGAGYDRKKTEADMVVNTSKRAAESSSDDVRECDDLIKRTMALFKEWTAARDAARNAAMVRA